MTTSTGYTDAGRMMAIKGSGWRAMGIASFSNSAALFFAGEEGGGVGVAGGLFVGALEAGVSAASEVALKTSATMNREIALAKRRNKISIDSIAVACFMNQSVGADARQPGTECVSKIKQRRMGVTCQF